MCLANHKNSRLVGGDGSADDQSINGAISGQSNRGGSSSADSSSKMLGAVFTSLVALYVGMNRFNMTFYLAEQSSGGASKPMACCGILVVLAIKVWNDRVGHMVENYSKKVDNVMMRVSSNKTLTRIKSSSMRLLDMATGRHESDGLGGIAEYRLSPKLSLHSAPFLSSEIIAKLSLIDIRDLFRYIVEMNRADFDRHLFLSEISSWYCREAIHVMDRAVVSSRGGESSMPTTATCSAIINECKGTTTPEPTPNRSAQLDASDIDALYFVAVACIFAEWRMARLVPPTGYHRYSIGMGLAKRDLIQNARKMECAVHQYMMMMPMVVDGHSTTKHACRSTTTGTSHDVATNQRMSPSPTIRRLIQWEIDRHVHANLPKLKEKSGASGFLWIYRQVQYQNNIFHNVLQIPETYGSSKAAVTAAYRSTYDNYHGFIVKNIFTSSFDAAPSHDVILRSMNPHTATTADPALRSTDRIAVAHSSSIVTAAMTPPQQRNPWEHVAHHFVGEWMKLERLVNGCYGLHNESNPYRNGLIVPDRTMMNPVTTTTAVLQPLPDMSSCDDDDHTDRAARDNIQVFRTTLEPMLSQWQILIHHWNINDPSKC